MRGGGSTYTAQGCGAGLEIDRIRIQTLARKILDSTHKKTRIRRTRKSSNGPRIWPGYDQREKLDTTHKKNRIRRTGIPGYDAREYPDTTLGKTRIQRTRKPWVTTHENTLGYDPRENLAMTHGYDPDMTNEKNWIRSTRKSGYDLQENPE